MSLTAVLGMLSTIFTFVLIVIAGYCIYDLLREWKE